MKQWLFTAGLLASSVGACAPRMVFVARVVPVNTGGMERPVTPPEKVRVFSDTPPEGFSLADGALRVDPGLGHAVVAQVEIKAEMGDCRAGNEHDTRETILREMREAAARSGGNAVLFAWTPLDPHDLEARVAACAEDLPSSFVWVDRMVWGRGWIVHLEGLGGSTGPGENPSQPSDSTRL